jgi:26S proteasome regulatory subunit N2
MWYWSPLIHMFSLTLTPTALIGLTEKLKIPKNFCLKCNAKPSIFAYPDPLQPPKKEEDKKAATAVLSTAAKAKQLKEKKEKEEKETSQLTKSPSAMDVDADDKASVANSAAEVGSVGVNASVMATPGTTIVGSTADSIAPSDLASDMMDVEEPAATPQSEEKKAGDTAAASSEKKEGDGEAKEKEGKENEKEGEDKKAAPEPTEEILKNPCRVLGSQQQFICFPSEVDGQAARYTPLLGEKRKRGFLMMIDKRPDEPEDLFQDDEKREDEEDEKEPDPPAPFEWTEAADA